MRVVAFLILFLSTFNVYALLPPFYQSTKEIIAILNNSEVANKLGAGRSISEIIKTDTGYKVVTRECRLEIKVVYSDRKDRMVGPAEFKIELGELSCQSERASL
jgi:hypothetical protein